MASRRRWLPCRQCTQPIQRQPRTPIYWQLHKRTRTILTAPRKVSEHCGNVHWATRSDLSNRCSACSGDEERASEPTGTAHHLYLHPSSTSTPSTEQRAQCQSTVSRIPNALDYAIDANGYLYIQLALDKARSVCGRVLASAIAAGQRCRFHAKSMSQIKTPFVVARLATLLRQ